MWLGWSSRHLINFVHRDPSYVWKVIDMHNTGLASPLLQPFHYLRATSIQRSFQNFCSPRPHRFTCRPFPCFPPGQHAVLIPVRLPSTVFSRLFFGFVGLAGHRRFFSSLRGSTSTQPVPKLISAMRLPEGNRSRVEFFSLKSASNLIRRG